MPARPMVSDVYRAENLPGVVFEQVTVKEVDKTVDGPTRPIEGAMVGEELHMEGDLEDKTFAPGYGEFFSGYRAQENFEANALTVPADALEGPTPAELEVLSAGADAVLAAAGSHRWEAATAALAKMTGAFDTLRRRGVPDLLGRQLNDALDALDQRVRERRAQSAARAALAVASAGLDIELRYRPPVEIDLARLDLRARQLVLDAAAGDKAAAAGEVTTLEWIRDRLALEDSQARDLDAQLRYLKAATEARELAVVRRAGAWLRQTIAGLAPQN